MNMIDVHTNENASLVTFYSHKSDALENAKALRAEGNAVKVGRRALKVPTGTITLFYTAIVD